MSWYKAMLVVMLIFSRSLQRVVPIPCHLLPMSCLTITPLVPSASSCVNQSSNPGDVSFSLTAFNLQLASLKSEIRSLQDSISVKESELYKVSIRKEFLWDGILKADLTGFLAGLVSCLQIVAKCRFGVSATAEVISKFFDHFWYGQFKTVWCFWIEKIFQILGSSKGRKISDSGSSKGRKVLDSCFLVTKAMTVLSKKFGSFNEMDGTEVCKKIGPGLIATHVTNIFQCRGAGAACQSESCQEKSLASNGINQASKSSLIARSPYLDYPVGLFHTTEDEVATETTTVAETCQQQSNTGPSIPGKVHILDNLPSNENGIFDDELELGRGRSTLSNEKNQLSSVKVKSQALGINKSFTVRESSVRPLVGRDFEILRRLKINLLDMDAALPEEALRASRSHSDRRYSWRAFVKSAATVYEMIQATIILEDTIKTEYLRNDWWYWSSPSAAAKISTLSALALRLYALDSAILYEKHLANEEATEASKPECQSEKAAPQNSKSGSPPTQKQPDSEPAESSKAKTRASKRRKDSGG
nr:methyl-cpg-binding domain-containing protein 9 [Ipomoea batatas]